jgi:hypothetical protein
VPVSCSPQVVLAKAIATNNPKNSATNNFKETVTNNSKSYTILIDFSYRKSQSMDASIPVASAAGIFACRLARRLDS